ncbi:hypothetical protein [Brackiella oedipodis]|uniref:hypothetical protein n=1 Tax=Brackiella oedipodis TaxID=124225 RepID=UPI000687FD89|nr:hypothetical protein [Brackiella oedipodis]
MTALKSAFKSAFIYLLLVCSLLTAGVPSHAQEMLNSEAPLGFRTAAEEVAINPCLSDTVLLEAFGREALPIAARERQQWPADLCQNLRAVSQLQQWHYFSTAVLANTDRIQVVGTAIKQRQGNLQQCRSAACIAALLPKYNEWIMFNFKRSPIASGVLNRKPKLLVGEAVELPNLALRNLVLPLKDQEASCGGTDMSDLNFSLATIKIPAKTIVVAQCAKDKNQRLWLLQNRNAPTKGWDVIFSVQNSDQVFALPDVYNDYPLLFGKSQDSHDGRLNLFFYSPKNHHYIQVANFVLGTDGYGLLHAILR